MSRFNGQNEKHNRQRNAFPRQTFGSRSQNLESPMSPSRDQKHLFHRPVCFSTVKFVIKFFCLQSGSMLTNYPERGAFAGLIPSRQVLAHRFLFWVMSVGFFVTSKTGASVIFKIYAKISIQTFRITPNFKHKSFELFRFDTKKTL